MLKFILVIMLFFIACSANVTELITPIPQNIKYDKQKALLGKKLFSDPRLSRDNTISCASCHNLSTGGDDNKQFSTGIDGKVGNINSPTVFNTTFNLSQLWSGKAKNLKDQAYLSLFKSSVMDGNKTQIIEKLNQDAKYSAKFKTIFTDAITIENVIDAIAEFEKALITPNSKFDKYLRGDKNSLNIDEKKGYKLFKSYGCISCHNGVNIGGNLYQKFGIIKQYKDITNQLGRYNVTANEEDKYHFKVPSLRNIELTAPYLHNRSIKTLASTIEKMIVYQIGQTPNKEDIQKIEAFLNTLTGDKPIILEKI